MPTQDFAKFLKNNKNALFAAYIITLAAFGFMLTNHTISIDEELWLVKTTPDLFWVQQGRFGIALLNLVFSPAGDYAPFLWDFLAVSLWFFSGVLSYYILFEQSGILKKRSAALIIYCAYFSTVPLVAGEILAFSMFNLQVALGMNMVMLSFSFLLDWARQGKKLSLVWAALLLAFAVSIYQAFLCVFATMTAAYMLLSLPSGTARPGKFMGKAFIVCAAGVLLYSLILLLLSVLTPQSGYLADSYLGWRDKRGFAYALMAAAANVVRYSLGLTIKGLTVYGGLEIGIATCCLLAFALLRLIKEKGFKKKAGYLILPGLLIAAPFALYLLLGTHNTSGRMLLGMPIVQGLGVVMLLEELKNKRVRFAALALCGLMLFLNARNMNTLYYYGSVAYNHDVMTAQAIADDIREAGADYHQKPVVFVGKYEMDGVKKVSSGTVGQSFFAWDDGNNVRIANFYNTLGYAFIHPSRAACRQAAELAKGMAHWPAEGSILEKSDIIVVSLSEPSELWYGGNAK